MSVEAWSALLGGIAGACIAGVIGVWAATYSQDRADAKRQQSAALAIREDLRRIHSELAVPGVDNIKLDSSGKPLSPEIHRWIVGLIPELASALPQAFARLMELQSALEERDKLLDRYLDAINSYDWARDQFEKNKENQKSAAPGQGPIYADESRRLEALVAGDGNRMESDRVRFAENEEHVRRIIKVLDGMLSTVIARPIPPQIPSLPTAEELDRRLPLR